MTHIISIVSQKGGSGKTTTAINLAVAAYQDGMDALIVDLDMQASATGWHQARADKVPHVQPTHPAALEGVLSAARAQGVDFVFIDTAAKTETDALIAIEAAGEVIIPCRPSQFDLLAIMNTVRLCTTRSIVPHILLNQVEPQRVASDEAREQLVKLGFKVLGHTIGRRTAFVHSINDGRGVCEYEPRGKAAQEVRALFAWIKKRSGVKGVKTARAQQATA